MKSFLNMLSMILIIIGALNWGLWGFFQFDFVAWLFQGNTTWMSRLIYSIIGLAGVWSLGFFCKKCRAMCCCGSCAKGSGKDKDRCCKM